MQQYSARRHGLRGLHLDGEYSRWKTKLVIENAVDEGSGRQEARDSGSKKAKL